MPDQNIQELQVALRNFANDRDWDQFHSVKNLLMALTGEVGELVEIFQWLDEEQINQLDDSAKESIAGEIADVLLYLLRIADKLNIDPSDAAWQKLKINAEKYPISLSKGNATKYNRR